MNTSRIHLGNYFELSYADIPSFAKAPIFGGESLDAYDVAVFGIPWDATATLRSGARLGPRGIREQSVWLHEIWNPSRTPLVSCGPVRNRKRDRIKMVDCGDVTIWPTDIVKTSSSIRETAATIASNAFPIMLGGDHYVMFPTYQGVCDSLNGKRVGIVQIDAHCDLVDNDIVYGTHWSGTPMRRALDHSGISPKAHAQIGLRGYVGSVERQFQIDNGTTTIFIPEIRDAGPEAVAEKAMDAVLQHCDVVYLTVDIDSVDPAFATGCSTPVPGGLLSDEFLTLLRAFGKRPEIVALDLVEVAPPLDPTHQTTLLAAYGLMGFIEEHFLLESG